jgi:plasmid stabilization system protein ParE
VPASSFRFHPAAELELGEAAEWYEERRGGLGLEFLIAIREKIFALMDSPERWRLVNGTRRALLEGFPYAVVYREISPDQIEIVAIAHVRRRPKFWTKR